MSKISVIYLTMTGNTKDMADAIAESIKAEGKDVYVSSIIEMNKDEVLSSDIIALGTPAAGSEEIDANYVIPFLEEEAAKLAGKKMFLFGSYGWGGGEFMDVLKEKVAEVGAELIAEPIIALESPDDDALEALKASGKEIAAL